MNVQGYFRILSLFDVSEAFELERFETLYLVQRPRRAPRVSFCVAGICASADAADRGDDWNNRTARRRETREPHQVLLVWSRLRRTDHRIRLSSRSLPQYPTAG